MTEVEESFAAFYKFIEEQNIPRVDLNRDAPDVVQKVYDDAWRDIGEQISKLLAVLRRVTPTESGQTSNTSRSSPNLESAYMEFLKTRSELLEIVGEKIEFMTRCKALSEAKLQTSDLDGPFELLTSWDTFYASTLDTIAQLEAAQRTLHQSHVLDCSLSEVYMAWDVLQELRENEAPRLQHEKKRREDMDLVVRDFLSEARAIMTRCTQMRDQLESTSSAELVQTFCTSLDFPKSDLKQQIIVLLDRSPPLFDFDEVQKEVSRIFLFWTDLHMLVYERLQKETVIEYEQSGLPQRFLAWEKFTSSLLEWFPETIKRIEESDQLEPEESKLLLSSGKDLWEACKVLHQQASTSSKLLSRVEKIQEGYRTLKRFFTSPLARMCQLRQLTEKPWKRISECTRGAEKLSEWIETQSKKDFWVETLERIKKLRLMLSEHIKLLTHV